MAGTAQTSQDTVNVFLEENRSFPPSDEFKGNAGITDNTIYEQANADREGFWAKQAENLDWIQKWDKVLDWQAPFAKWFIGGKLNASYNCLDRHIKAGLGNKTAIIWEGEPGDQQILTYDDVYKAVNKFANGLKSLGVKKGDRVAIYMPMVPEAVYAMQACARIGAVHTVVFGGFSVDSLKDRIEDAQAKVVITADGGWRRGKVVPLKETTDKAVEQCDSIEHVIVVKRTENDITMKEGRDVWHHDLIEKVEDYCKPEPMDAEDLLFILYTSGTTGKPKGIMHTTGGYMLGATMTTQWVFDLKPEDIFWCTADVGWVTGHSYIVYGPMANAATQVMYEGTPDFPERDRFWKIIEKHKVSIFYTAPTAIRAFMKWGTDWVDRCDLSSLRLLGSVGEPINPEAWMWYQKYIGKEKCPIVDTWWQTETGSIMISPLPGLTITRPGSATHPLPGIEAKVVTEQGKEIKEGGGYLSITSPWPSMLRGIWGNEQRYKDTYWSKWEGVYFPGDGAKVDEDGYLWLLGRVDDVMNIAGHNIGTAEVESALVDHQSVAESAVVGISDEIKGQAIAAFVILKEGNEPSKEEEDVLKEHVAKKIGAIARPKKIIFTADLPKTRSGKIMRRLLRDIAEGRALGDVTTLADTSIVESLKQKYQEE
ncbi:Acetyl-CoA synthetase [hydrothermal vent metagenome]|uniref:acetate--CoA ligase n=1 Tax=hydrothermal vent metagenome TaxID=652676 RepID=A0A3B1DC56_9ZZZZ